jgi:predicted component of type VI protein secretion system
MLELQGQHFIKRVDSLLLLEAKVAYCPSLAHLISQPSFSPQRKFSTVSS